jgi:serine/threonine-protein kinase
LADRYTIERELGRGGMAIVYLARDLRHERLVALKALRPELAASLGPERFLREIRVVAGLTHPHILPLHDSGEASGCLYYVMPYVAGESLRDRLDRESPLPAQEAIALARQVASALDHAHREGIVHRDIKPENILLEAGHAVVADFGIARAVSAARGGGGRLTQAGLAVGTPDYMSPEQATGEEEVDGRSDIYSLGCVLYEMLTGRVPERGRALSLTGLRPSVPVGLREALERALASEPAGRFRTGEEFAAALSGLTSPAAPGRGGRRWLVPVTAGVVVVGVALAWALGRSRTAQRIVLDPTHIAVLYFSDLSDSGTLGHIANGLTEELIDELGRVPVLHVRSSTAVRPYRNTTLSLDSLARALEVGTVVEGRVARSGARLRASVRLIDVATGDVQSTFVELPRADLFELQDSITVEIAEFLRERLGQVIQTRQHRSETRSVEAWETFQRAQGLLEDGRALYRHGNLTAALEVFHRTDSLLARAESLDATWNAPTLSRGWLALSEGSVFLAKGPATLFASRMRKGIGFADRVLAGKPPRAMALALRGTARFELWRSGVANTPDTLAAAERDLRDAVMEDRGIARAWYALTDLLYMTGRFGEAEQEALQALKADAYLSDARVVIINLYFAMLLREQFDDARSWCAQGVRRFPDDPNFMDCELRVLGWSAKGARQVARAWQLLQATEARDTIDPLPLARLDRRMMVAAVLARSEMADSARAVIRRATARLSDSLALQMASEEAYVRLLLGERDAALHLLGRYLKVKPQARGIIAESPWFRPLRTDSDFAALVRRTPPPPH